MYLATTFYYAVTHVLYHARKLVGSYVGMRIGKDCGTCSMLAEDIEHALDAATFLAAGVELAIGIGACTTLAKAVVRFGVHCVRAGY